MNEAHQMYDDLLKAASAHSSSNSLPGCSPYQAAFLGDHWPVPDPDGAVSLCGPK